ncbi:MAG: DNA repair protein RadA [Saccharofermentanales bacterium]|jgi:DNA repair protein RadA/Sms|nr:DNA repair protein RadA [Bacillota bacterium]
MAQRAHRVRLRRNRWQDVLFVGQCPENVASITPIWEIAARRTEQSAYYGVKYLQTRIMMAKKKTNYFCTECGWESSGWLGKCPGCDSWNSFVEVEKVTGKNQKPDQPSRGNWAAAERGRTAGHSKLMSLAEVAAGENIRVPTGITELDRVLGGGLVKGSIILLGGEPGIGKSTLVLQIMGSLPAGSSLYVSGEESSAQVKMRADRLGIDSSGIGFLAVTDFAGILDAVTESEPEFLVIDSIQTAYVDEIAAAPGSVTQIREVAAGLLRLAKSRGITVILIGHVTKDGNIAGPRVLEHMVDTVLYFEGEKLQYYRMLRAVKNRFGATDELGFFTMGDQGLSSLEKASEMLLSGRPLGVSGSVVTSTIEGTRPLLLEIQALIVPSSFAAPLRMAQGLDRMRLAMLLAVLDKKTNLGLSGMDAYINVTGGLRITETASDLAVLSAAVSSIKDLQTYYDAIILGEVGLTGEVRGISQIERRLSEAERTGWTRFVLPAANKTQLEKTKLGNQLELYYVSQINEAFDLLFP